MMKKKTLKTYEFQGFGFPVVLHNVPYYEFMGELVPEIQLNRLQDLTLKALTSKPAFLSGNEIRFIRQTLLMSYRDFGKLFGVTGPAVKKWEDKKNSPTGMSLATERTIRLYVFKKLQKSDLKGLQEIDRFLEFLFAIILHHQCSPIEFNYKEVA